MEIIAYGALADERPLLREAFDQAFGGHHELRCLKLFLNRDTAPQQSATRSCQRATGYNNIALAAAREHGPWLSQSTGASSVPRTAPASSISASTASWAAT